jgi:endonuclease/exonuclease/phosphatase family metal-dependent hydrolase
MPVDAGADDALAPSDASVADGAPSADAGPPTRVRIMAANTTSGTQQSYEAPGIRIFQGLHPDVVLIQEFDYPGGQRALVDTAFGTDFAFFVEPRTGGIPNGVVSRFPIVASGVWTDASTTDRAFAWARIDVPGPIDLWAVSVHLLTTSATARSTEATQIVTYVTSNVPDRDYLVLGGDFNTDTTDEPALASLRAQVVVAAPFPTDQNGNTNTSINRNHPHDWLLARANLDARKTPVSIGAATFASGLVFDSRVYTPLADVAPVLAGDSATTGMQHMPVVRDFVLGGP